jgi:hypothetical protein
MSVRWGEGIPVIRETSACETSHSSKVSRSVSAKKFISGISSVVRFMAISMVVSDFHIGRLSVIPSENQAPLLIDLYAPETLEIAGEGFEWVAGWDSQILQNFGGVKLPWPKKSPRLNFSRHPFRPTTVPDPFGFFA